MVRKAFTPLKGIKATTPLTNKKGTPHKQHKSIDDDNRIKICLACTKPASECKGNCFGGV